MGRGRAKAKQTKVARQLKYDGGRTDLSRLAEELASTRQSQHQAAGGEQTDGDPYADYYDSADDDEDDDQARRRA